jgi:predicted ATPase/class 3 adenylate cyclase
MMASVRRHLPSGTVTFLFTDIEGSTQLLHQLGARAYANALLEHRRVVREAVARHGGVEVGTEGDSFFVVFPAASDAVEAAAEAQEALAQGPISVRMGVHTGTANLVEDDYVGEDVHRGARIAAAGHGGQVLVSKATRQLVQADLTELGEHRLKDFDQPVALFQLGSKKFPPLKTISNTNLPRPASSFVGREREVAEIVSLLSDGARLLTLTGPGGSGKTRLAIEAAAELVPEFRAGVFWIGLATLRDATLVTDIVAQTLGAKDGLIDHMGERELLLVLDNLEQVIEAASELSKLVEACPNLKLLITSRELLRVRGEVEYPVFPLAEPEAVELFTTRAGVEPDETVHRLCRELDNLPLALELAAARASVLSPKQILERLAMRLDLLKGGRDSDPRQQTLRATIEWSYDLLSMEEKALFARLAVFRGGCTLEASEEVAEAGLDTLQSLVDKSLLRHTFERFWMLETIREYAVERLEDSGDGDELRRRHAEHFLALAEEAEPNLRGNPKEWLDPLEREHDNLRAALDSLAASSENQFALRLAGALWKFWSMRGHLAEGRRRLEEALRTDDAPTAARAKALNGASAMALEGGDTAMARLRVEEALALHRILGDASGTANSLLILGNVHAEERDFATAKRLFEASVRAFRQLGDEHYTLLATRLLAWMFYDLGDHEQARALHEDVVRQARATGNERMQATSLGALAEYALYEGRVQDALPMLKESTRIYRDNSELPEIAVNLFRFARAAAVEGRAGAAAQLFSSAEGLGQEIGVSWSYWVVEMNEGTLATIRTLLDEAAYAVECERGRNLTADEAVALALDS